MGTYEGTCRYCGSLVSVIANSQEEADMVASKECGCENGILEMKREKLFENITEVCLNGRAMRTMNGHEIKVTQTIASQIFEETITNITIGFEHSNIRIWEAGEKIKVKRTVKNEETREA